MYMGDMRTCLYDDGTTLSMESGPCQDVLSTGAYLVDDVTEAGGGITRVETGPPMSWSELLAMVSLGVLLLSTIGGGAHVSKRRRRR